ncbi:thioesterase-like superfamily-domain-containing protein [Pyronema omphalodes]|nr:thioesterase-like superfamily-domain-containing protein [Pyronema omphalodes]
MRPVLRLATPLRFQLLSIRHSSSAAAAAVARAPTVESSSSPSPSRAETPLNPRWLATQKQRIGKLLFHGATVEEQKQAAVILKDLAENWRDYVAGAEGFLVGPTRRGLYRHAVAWGDMAHVNNVTYTRWAESARINWARNIASYVDPSNAQKWAQLWTPKGLGLILRSIKVEYKFPMIFPDRVTVYHKLSRQGIDHFILDVMILSEKHQRPAARCIEDIVVYDYVPADTTKPPGKAPIPGFILRVFEETARQQEMARVEARNRMREIEERIMGLEKTVLGREEM